MNASVKGRQLALASLYPTWEPRTLDQALSHAAKQWPNNEFIVSEQRSYTYQEIDEWAARLAGGLIASGVNPGDHVALLMANYPEFVAIKFAISRVGAVAVPINFLNRRDELAYVLKQSDARCLITMNAFRDLNYLQMLDDIEPRWRGAGNNEVLPELRSVFVFSTGDTLPHNVREFNELEGEQALGSKGDPLVDSDIIYTSGTTGGPKGVLLSHEMLLRAAFGSVHGRAFNLGRRILFSLPMYHVFGYVEGLLAAMLVGGAAIIQRQFTPHDTLAAVAKHSAEDLLLIPTMTMAVIEQMKSDTYDVSSVKAMLSSGGKSPAGIWELIYQCFGDIEVTTGYGMTEATASSTVTRPDDPLSRLISTNGRLRDIGIAAPADNDGKLVNYRVVDTETGETLPPGSMGELRMRGFGVTRGYYNKPVETAEAFDSEGWFRTGDLGTLDEDGYLTLKGRTKESYRCGGELVLPLEVETALAAHPAVNEVHVVAIPDQRMGEVGVACVVRADDTHVDEQELIDLCKQNLARFKVPKHILFFRLEDIPTTPTGRPRKFLLVERVINRLNETAKEASL